jgi:hypothetical protein
MIPATTKALAHARGFLPHIPGPVFPLRNAAGVTWADLKRASCATARNANLCGTFEAGAVGNGGRAGG